MSQEQGRDEKDQDKDKQAGAGRDRGRTHGPEGTDNPYKKMRPDPDDPNKVIFTDKNGHDKTKAKPPGFDEHWKGKHPEQYKSVWKTLEQIGSGVLQTVAEHPVATAVVVGVAVVTAGGGIPEEAAFLGAAAAIAH